MNRAWLKCVAVVGIVGLAAWTAADDVQARREAALAETLAGATLTGTWQQVEADGLSAPQSDRYTISRATKEAGQLWLIHARIQYGQKDVTLPVRVRVVWAEDTPVITVTNLFLPGLGTYSARVMIHGNLYCGTWSAGDHGGVLSGRVMRDVAASRPASGPKS